MIDKRLKYLKNKAPKGEFLAYINAEEAAMLKRAGGSGKKVNGIPSFRPQDMGNAANQAASAAAAGPSNSSDDKGSDTPETTRHNPHTVSGTSKTSVVTGKQMAAAQRDFVQTLNHNNAIEAARTGTKFSPYTGGASFAPTATKGFNWKGALLNLGLMAINPALAAKYGKVKSLYSGAKYAGKLANDLGLTNTNVVDSFTDNVKGFTDNAKNNFTGFNTTSKGPKGPPDDRGNGDGGNEQNALMAEYLLLLQKLEQGVLQKEEQGRFNSLKSRLGKAYGGIMNVNMNRGQLGGMNG